MPLMAHHGFVLIVNILLMAFMDPLFMTVAEFFSLVLNDYTHAHVHTYMLVHKYVHIPTHTYSSSLMCHILSCLLMCSDNCWSFPASLNPNQCF